MASSWLLVGLVAAVGVAAALDAFRGGESPGPAGATAREAETAPASQGPPRPGLLPPAQLAGTLWLIEGEGCRLRSVALEEAKPTDAGPATGCALWAAPNGQLAVVPRGRPSPDGDRTVWLVRLERPPALVRALGRARGEASWSPDSHRLAWCDRRGTVVLDLVNGRRERLRGCRPRFGSDGSVLTRPDRPLAAAVLRDGRPLLAEDDLRAGFGSPSGGLVDVLAYDLGSRGLLAVGAAYFRSGRRPRIAVQVWQGERHVTTVPLEGFGGPTGPYRGLGKLADAVEFSPDGRELAVVSHERGLELRLFAVGSWEEVLRRGGQSSVDWSPDGSWLVLAMGSELNFVGPARGAAEHVLPLSAVALAWRP